MKLLLLKILLQRRARDEGFTLPMVIALGLVMILLGAVSMTIANEENITAIAQNSRSDALAIAEVGVARYRETLDRNRRLAINDSSQWGTLTGICNNNTNETTTTDDYFPSLTENVANTIALAEDGQVLNNDGDNTDSFNIGSYSLVSYDYSNTNDTFDSTNDTNNSNARGILTVKGTAPDGSEAQIEAEIPVRINLEDMNTIAPALWVGSTSPTLGNLTIGNGNVVIKDPATSTADGCGNFSALASTSRPVISDSRDLPPITKITTDIADAKSKWSITTGSVNNFPSTVTEPRTVAGVTTQYKKVIFASTTDKTYKPIEVGPPIVAASKDCPNIKKCRYYYDSDPTDTSVLTYTDTDLLTDGIAGTTMLLNRPLKIEATNTVGTGQNVKIGSTSPVANDSNTFEIYVNGNHGITIEVASGRTVTINGFIHAPQSTLTVEGSGIVNINGSVWVNNFVNSTATVNISPDMITRVATPDDPSTSGRGYRFYSTTASRTPRPITGSPTNWKTEQVN
ncbi:MAG: hypothetical protein KME09_13050 [Pleurocapsa minor HA4230-MV1]|jgi:hypothetical protein|nr:hypothetical protein [Pleurocapsa minor HA4230-MV1]